MGQSIVSKYFIVIIFCNLGCLLGGNELIEVNRVVARVNGEVITWGEIELALQKLNFSEKEKLQRASEFVDGKIDRLLSQVAFQEKGMAIPETYVEQEYSSKLMSNFNGDRRLFRKVLQSNGQSPMEYKEQLKEDIIHMHMLSQRKRTRDDISPQSVEDYYQLNQDDFRTEKRLRLSEIVFSENDSEQGNLSNESKRIHTLLQKKPDFNLYASQNGQSPFRAKGGDWGVFVTSEEIRNSKIRKVAFGLKEGEFSEPFSVDLLEQKKDGSVGPSGKVAWYILKVSKIEKAKLLGIDEVRIEIEGILSKNLELSEQRKWLSRQKKNAYIKVNLPE
jgi:peptidyl-prolyl cis-trans isomerase SurA